MSDYGRTGLVFCPVLRLRGVSLRACVADRDPRGDLVVREVGTHTEIILDTGIMSGADIIASVALGARFTLIGRAYLYGLMAGGRQGVDRAIEILRTQLIRTMGLLGVSSLDELNPEHVTQLARLVPLSSSAQNAIDRM